ncbi:hypothetical protein FH972_023718 [Carpinus fangiana]|uniref:Peroxin 26 n=1 Tax=Carpinus fangiana TaxID=176857 RepID=A0A5N6KWS6_9ROSI|nr:hypothetical protein FH972_023718 [Carpinus fangiana]
MSGATGSGVPLVRNLFGRVVVAMSMGVCGDAVVSSPKKPGHNLEKCALPRPPLSRHSLSHLSVGTLRPGQYAAVATPCVFYSTPSRTSTTEMTSTSTSTFLDPDSNNPRLTSSVSSLSSSQSSLSITQIYKHASNLFLTRRIQEALEAIQPLLKPASDDSPAPIAAASRGARIKVWSLYCSMLNEVVEMGPEDGKRSFGAAQWKELAAKARDGTVWDDVVRDGYQGSEGDVDADVVATLATLLLAHAPSQKSTQQRLEAYLSATGTSIISPSSINNALNRPKQTSSSTNGTSTPRDLASRLKILEIYTLHVLPRNEEWAYAREFISLSEVLDDERREAFLAALQSLQDENSIEARREAELTRQREMQLEDQRRADQEKAALEARTREKQEKAEAEARKRRADREAATARTIERDFGMDKSPKAASSSKAVSSQARGSGSAGKASVGPAAKRGAAPRPSSYYKRASSILAGIQHAIMTMGSSLRANPVLLLRFMAFVIAFLMAFARRDVRERVRAGWDKIKGTVGMGVKVSYI